MILYRTMQLSLENRTIDDVVVIRCHGRVVSGEEASHLQAEIGRLTALTKNVVLNLAEVTYVDSGGLGSLVRIYGVLRAARGDLKICQLSPFVEQVLEATNLLKVFQPVASEAEALGAFVQTPCISAGFSAAVHDQDRLPGYFARRAGLLESPAAALGL